ncbi:alpha/beta hydrolase [Streptomyces sp. NPDC048290]|uniref:alpha/beta fold hydrolase n=1 Tax=Streptomyces sp. NPDC048290 TaxID=3155811 RepID=UPI0034398873
MKAKTALPRPRNSVLTLGVAAVGATAVALALTVPASASATSTSPAPKQKPTVVLVHGAFVDASSWSGVIGRLQGDGYKVIAPANPLRGLASDAAYLRSVLKTIDGPIVLAGHSYGGAVISQAAAGNKKVKALVYVAAFAPDRGESVTSVNSNFPPAPLGNALVPTPYPLPDGSTGTELSVQPDKFHEIVAADAPEAVANVAAAAQRPAAANIFTDISTRAAWKTIPSWGVIATQDQAINPDAQTFMAKRAHARITEVDASHAIPLTRPDTVTDVIEQAAKTTVR